MTCLVLLLGTYTFTWRINNPQCRDFGKYCNGERLFLRWVLQCFLQSCLRHIFILIATATITTRILAQLAAPVMSNLPTALNRLHRSFCLNDGSLKSFQLSP